MKRASRSMRKINPAWNKLGPPIPCWFRVKMKAIDPRLILQFTPPQCKLTNFKGVPRNIYPYGVWDICYKIPKTNYLHSVAVWSLADMNGLPALPGMDTVKLLRLAVRLHRSRQTEKLERAMSFAIQEWNTARAKDSKDELHSAIRKFCSLFMGRQWQNRLSMRREGPTSGTKGVTNGKLQSVS